MTTSRLFSLAIPLLVTSFLPCPALGQPEVLTVNPQTGEQMAIRFNAPQRSSFPLRGREQKRAFIQLAERTLDPDAWCAKNAPRIFECGDPAGLYASRLADTPLTAVFYKARLHDDVLTVQLRFHNDGLKPARLTIDPETPGSVFVQVGEDRLGILTDEDGEQQTKGALDEVLDPGEIESWWARFPAPSSEATSFDLHIPAVTFRDVPLEDD